MELSINIGNLLSRYDLETSIDLAKQAGFTAMDYSLMDMVSDDAPFNGDNYPELAYAVRALADAKGFPVNQTHAPFSFGSKLWGDPDYYQNVILPRMIRSIEISGILGAKVIVIHPLHHIPYRGNEETLFRMNMDYYRSLIPYAAKAGVKIGVENMFQSDPLRKYIVADTCSTAEEFVRYIDELNSEHITACLDIGHVALPLTDATAADVIRALGHHRLGALHVHDNDYTRDLHILPYLGKLNWAEICAALGEIDYQGDFTYEVNGQLFLNCDEEFVPLGVGFMGTVGKHLCSMVEANRKTL